MFSPPRTFIIHHDSLVCSSDHCDARELPGNGSALNEPDASISGTPLPPGGEKHGQQQFKDGAKMPQNDTHFYLTEKHAAARKGRQN